MGCNCGSRRGATHQGASEGSSRAEAPTSNAAAAPSAVPLHRLPCPSAVAEWAAAVRATAGQLTWGALRGAAGQGRCTCQHCSQCTPCCCRASFCCTPCRVPSGAAADTDWAAEGSGRAGPMHLPTLQPLHPLLLPSLLPLPRVLLPLLPLPPPQPPAVSLAGLQQSLGNGLQLWELEGGSSHGTQRGSGRVGSQASRSTGACTSGGRDDVDLLSAVRCMGMSMSMSMSMFIRLRLRCHIRRPTCLRNVDVGAQLHHPTCHTTRSLPTTATGRGAQGLAPGLSPNRCSCLQSTTCKSQRGQFAGEQVKERQGGACDSTDLGQLETRRVVPASAAASDYQLM